MDRFIIIYTQKKAILNWCQMNPKDVLCNAATCTQSLPRLYKKVGFSRCATIYGKCRLRKLKNLICRHFRLYNLRRRHCPYIRAIESNQLFIQPWYLPLREVFNRSRNILHNYSH